MISSLLAFAASGYPTNAVLPALLVAYVNAAQHCRDGRAPEAAIGGSLFVAESKL